MSINIYIYIYIYLFTLLYRPERSAMQQLRNNLEKQRCGDVWWWHTFHPTGDHADPVTRLDKSSSFKNDWQGMINLQRPPWMMRHPIFSSRWGQRTQRSSPFCEKTCTGHDNLKKTKTGAHDPWPRLAGHDGHCEGCGQYICIWFLAEEHWGGPSWYHRHWHCQAGHEDGGTRSKQFERCKPARGREASTLTVLQEEQRAAARLVPQQTGPQSEEDERCHFHNGTPKNAASAW